MQIDHRDTARAMAEDHAALEPQEQPRMWWVWAGVALCALGLLGMGVW